MDLVTAYGLRLTAYCSLLTAYSQGTSLLALRLCVLAARLLLHTCHTTHYGLLTTLHYLHSPTHLHPLQADPPRDTYIDPDTGYSVFTQVSEYVGAVTRWATDSTLDVTYSQPTHKLRCT